MVVIKIGSHGEEVRQIQTELQRLGLYAGPIDGAFGGGTASAVKAFQLSKGLPVDGQIARTVGTHCSALAGCRVRPFSTRISTTAALPSPVLLRPISVPQIASVRSAATSMPGMSFGVLRWNFGQGTLQQLLQDFIEQHPDVARSVFRMR